MPDDDSFPSFGLFFFPNTVQIQHLNQENNDIYVDPDNSPENQKLNDLVLCVVFAWLFRKREVDDCLCTNYSQPKALFFDLRLFRVTEVSFRRLLPDAWHYGNDLTKRGRQALLWELAIYFLPSIVLKQDAAGGQERGFGL